jgi:cell wall-associated NlpC family hydrolase
MGEIHKAINQTVRELLSSTDNRYDFNCWGFTSYVNRWTEYPEWLNDNDMENLLEEYSYSIPRNELMPGDILVFRDCGELEHTAIYTGNGRIIHKPGALSLERTTVKRLLRDIDYYGYGEIADYRRVYTPIC